MFKKNIVPFILLFGGCSSYKSFDAPINSDLQQAKVIITDGTKRIAVLFPNGNVCNEMGPSITNSITESANLSGRHSGVKASGSEQFSTTQVPIEISTERVECLRISMFHACGLAQNSEMKPDAINKLYQQVISSCGKWQEDTSAAFDTEEPQTLLFPSSLEDD